MTLVGGILLALGCAPKKQPSATLEPPPVNVVVSNYLGTGLTGPQATGTTSPASKPADSPADALAVRFVATSLLQPPGEPGKSLGQVARLIVSQRDGVPVLPSTRLTIGCRIATGDEATTLAASIRGQAPGATVAIADESTALPRGTTAAVSLLGNSGEGLPRFTVSIARTNRPNDDQGLELAIGLIERVIVVDDASSDDSADAKVEAPPTPQTVVQRELAVVPLPASQSEALILAPIRFGEHAGKSLAVSVSITPGSDDPAHLKLVNDSLSRISKAGRDASKTPIDPASLAVRGAIDSTIAISQDPRRRRSALVLLSSTNNAPIATDFSLLADDAMLEQLSKRLTDQAAVMPPETTPGQWGLTLDLMALSMLAELQANNKVPPEMDSILAIHTGEAGRHAGTVDEIIRGVARRADLDTRLVAENLIYLEDQSPAARVRAFDWLASRGKAPAGFDPLGDARSRRNALEAALAATTQPTQP